MRVAILLAVITFAAAPACDAQRRSSSPFETRAAAPVPGHYELPSARTESWPRHLAVGMAAGGAAGLVWGLTRLGDENVFGLSPVIETAIGIGVGGYAGTAVYLVRRLRP